MCTIADVLASCSFYFSVIVELYGWYSDLGPRANRGELERNDEISEVNYLEYNNDIFEAVASSQRFFFFAFQLSSYEETVTDPPTIITDVPDSSISIYPIIGVVVGVVVAVIVLVVIVLVVCLLGRRKDDPKKKRQLR